MHIWVDSADPEEIEEWDEHPWVTGFTTNPSLIKAAGSRPGEIIKLTEKPISIDGGEGVWSYGPNVLRKVTRWVNPTTRDRLINRTTICTVQGARGSFKEQDVLSVFAGRIMDTGRDPQPVIDAAKRTAARVLWASVREPYNILQAEQAGCDIVTVPPAILRKYLEWNGKPLEVVAAETIAQFERDAEVTQWP